MERRGLQPREWARKRVARGLDLGPRSAGWTSYDGPMDLAEKIFMYADELRAVAATGLGFSEDKPYDAERYRHVRSIAAKLVALVDPRPADIIEKTLFTQLTHPAPVPCGDAAIFDDEDRLLLIRRADDGLWALPGGLLELGETPVEGVSREALEEAGAKVQVTDLIGIYDSRCCGARSPVQLYIFVFHCNLIEHRPQWATTPHEVLDVGWFQGDSLPALSPGHTVRVPDAVSYHRLQVPTFFDGRRRPDLSLERP